LQTMKRILTGTVTKLGLRKEMRGKNKGRKCFCMEERGNLIPPQLRCVL
jgi:hypothetical protein